MRVALPKAALQLAKVASAAKSGKDIADFVGKFSPEQRERVQAWLTARVQGRSLDARTAKAVVLADQLPAGATTVEQKEAALAYGARARNLQQAVAIAQSLTGRERRKRLKMIEHRLEELHTEMLAALLMRDGLDPLG